MDIIRGGRAEKERKKKKMLEVKLSIYKFKFSIFKKKEFFTSVIEHLYTGWNDKIVALEKTT